MSTSPTINAMRRNRAEIAGLIRELDGKMHDLRRDLAHVDATMKLFDPTAEPKLIKPVRPYRPANRVFERKEVSIRVMNALREADGAALTLDALGARIIADKGLDTAATLMVNRVTAGAL